MNRKLRMLGLTAALVTVPVLAQAQQAFTVGVSGGVSLPIGTVGDIYSIGYQLAGHGYFRPPSMKGPIDFRGDFNFDRWESKSDLNLNRKARLLGGTANVLYHIGSTDMMARPYVLGGVGLQNVRTEGPGTPSGGVPTVVAFSDTKAAAQLGGGLEFQLSGFTTFFEARFVNRFSETSASRWIPITFGIHF